ncbi:hypothetical protein B6V75_01945 [Thioclava sp. F1Mire-8]|uniref:hypothetical protein n=1 Tax=Thioclava sp. F1Mire-8 TaxID=1973006 RepID=UPI000B53906A|nr:hypothetical protein [Thioclava sp. F1Mire-8]OWY04926.1 hypothetical protein B6V75_01945 [Thioclava sp. F1Mire-8]
MKLFAVTAAALLIAGGAHAQDAYITQLGDNLTGLNYSEYSNGTNVRQVIAQQGIGFRAANLSRGANNTAMTYQVDTRFDNSLEDTQANNNARTRSGLGAQMNSLVIQSGRGFMNGNNKAVTVQLANQAPGVQNANFRAQTIQEGNNNTGVNWQQNNGNNQGGMAGQTYGSISTPAFGFTNVGTAPLPSPIAHVSFPYGSHATIN